MLGWPLERSAPPLRRWLREVMLALDRLAPEKQRGRPAALALSDLSVSHHAHGDQSEKYTVDLLRAQFVTRRGVATNLAPVLAPFIWGGAHV